MICLPEKQRIYDYFYDFASEVLHIVIFENFVKSMMSCCLPNLKLTPKFCFPFKNSDSAICIDALFSVIDSGSNQFFQLLSKFHTTKSIKFFLLYKLNCYFLNILKIITLKDNCYLIHIMAEFVLFLYIFLSQIFLKTYKIKIFFCLFTFLK